MQSGNVGQLGEAAKCLTNKSEDEGRGLPYVAFAKISSAYIFPLWRISNYQYEVVEQGDGKKCTKLAIGSWCEQLQESMPR